MKKKILSKEHKRKISQTLLNRDASLSEAHKRSISITRGIIPDKYDDYSLPTHKRIRMKVLRAYSNDDVKCKCCGEETYEFLCIDHINGGGNKHRKKRGFGSRLYRWLAKKKYPKGFQVLCHNCNLAKGFYGVCPHKKK